MKILTRLDCHWWAVRSVFLFFIAATFLVGCAAQPQTETTLADFQREREQQVRVEQLNQQLLQQSQAAEAATATAIIQDEGRSDSYQVGPGDQLDIVVLGVPELSRKVRVDGNGTIALPLIGEVPVRGLTVNQVSKVVAEYYEDSYLNNPQVSVMIEEFRSREITVLGSVRSPKVYAVQRRMSLIETLAMAGGVTENAGANVYVSDVVEDPETKEKTRRNLIIALEDLTRGGPQSDMQLGESAIVNVPPAGVVYVEGAVRRPGVYSIERDTSVLKAIAMAGGLEFKAQGSAIQILRANEEQETGMQQFVDIGTIRDDPNTDITLEDGDVVVVRTNAVKSLLQGLFVTTQGFLGFGYRVGN